MNFNIKKAFINPFNDGKWIRKILIGGILASFIFTAPIANGYIVLYLYSLLKSNDKNLPQWTQIKKIFIISVKLIVIDIVYLLPVVFIGIITQPHDVFSFKKASVYWVPVVLISMFFLNIAHVTFVQNDYKISAGFNIGKIFSLLRSNIKHYLPIYAFNAALFLIILVPVFIDFKEMIGCIFNYFLIFLLSTFMFYSYLAIAYMLSMIFKKEEV